MGREEMVACKERGLLLLRVRTELKQTLMAYQELFYSSVTWCRRKMEEASQGWEELEEKSKRLAKEVAQLETEATAWKTEAEVIKVETEKQLEEKRKLQVVELQDFSRRNVQLKQQLELMPPEFLPPGFLAQRDE